MDKEIQRLVRVARVDLERALRIALGDAGPAALLAVSGPVQPDGSSEADALMVLGEAARLAIDSPERSVEEVIAECLTTEWMTASGARLYRVSLKPGQPVTDAHLRILGATPVRRVESAGTEEIWAGWVDVVRGIHVAFSRVEGAPRTRRVAAEEGKLIAQVARAIEARATRGLGVTGLWDRLESFSDTGNTDFLAAAEALAGLSADQQAVLLELCDAHLDGEPEAGDAEASRAGLDELLSGSGLSLSTATVDALLGILREGEGAQAPAAALLSREEQGAGLTGALGRLTALHEKVTGQPARTSIEERRGRAVTLRSRIGGPTASEESALAPVPELPADHAHDTSPGLPPVVVEALDGTDPTALFHDVEPAVPAEPAPEPVPDKPESAFWEPEIPWTAGAQVTAEPSVAALIPRRDVIEDLEAADISVVRERELEAQLIASDEAREHVRSDAAALELELDRARVELRAARREADALRNERGLLLGRVDGALRVLTGSQGSVVQLLSELEGPAPMPGDGPLLEPATTSPGLTRFAIGTAIALVVAAALVIAYLPSRAATATGPMPRESAAAPATPRPRMPAQETPPDADPIGTRLAPSSTSPELASPVADDEDIAAAEAAAMAEIAAPAPLPADFRASFMLTRRSKAFVHGDRRTRVVMELPEGPRLIGACVAAQSTPEAVGSPVYPGYEPVRIPCTGPYRDVCDSLGCDDASDRCDVAVSVVVPCAGDLPTAGGGPASAAAPRFDATLALGERSKVYSRAARDAVDLSSLPGGDAVLSRCAFAAATLDEAGTKAYPGYEPVSIRCGAETARLCEALGCISPDGVCHLLASNIRGCRPSP